VLAWEHTDESLARQLRRAEDIAAECAAADEQFRAEKDGGQAPAVTDGGQAPVLTDGGQAPALADGGQAPALADAFPPRPGSWCGWCDYRACCPEGSAASEQRRPWDALSAEVAGPPRDGAQADVAVAERGAVAHTAMPE
jgi:hypothetical protein